LPTSLTEDPELRHWSLLACCTRRSVLVLAPQLTQERPMDRLSGVVCPLTGPVACNQLPTSGNARFALGHCPDSRQMLRLLGRKEAERGRKGAERGWNGAGKRLKGAESYSKHWFWVREAWISRREATCSLQFVGETQDLPGQAQIRPGKLCVSGRGVVRSPCRPPDDPGIWQ
jgi:hypothetical protein